MALTRAAGVLSKLGIRKYPLLSGHASRSLSVSSSLAARTHVSCELKDDVAVIRLNEPESKVNTFSLQMQSELVEVIEETWSNKDVKGVVFISTKPGCFMAGADISMLQSFKRSEEVSFLADRGQKMSERIEKSPIPHVAAVHGSCLGGGLEFMITCHYRIATTSDKTVLGSPEVMLGLVPAAGGPQRLPEMVGLRSALDLMLTGRSIRARKAKKMGLVHQLVEPLGPGLKPAEDRTIEYLEEVAVGVAKDLANKKVRLTKEKSLMQKLEDSVMGFGPVRKRMFNSISEKVQKQTKGLYPAPAKVIECVQTGLEKGRDAGYQVESENFGKLAMTSESRALAGLYAGQVICRKNSLNAPEKEVKKLAVLGAGLMGAGVAQVSIDKGLTTILKDTTDVGISRGYDQVYKNLNKKVKKGILTPFNRDVTMSNLSLTLDYSGFESADMVIEAVFEDMNIKHKVLKEVEEIVPPHCIFASNTSGLPIRDIAAASKRPDKVIGMHYFSPVDRMQLLEIVVTDQTSEDTLSSAFEVGLKQGKTIIVVKDGPGFYTTRCFFAMMAECASLFLEGMGPEKVDTLAKNIGFPMGLASLLDEIGLDVSFHVAQDLNKAFSSRGGIDADIFKVLVEKGCRGRKSGRGLFIYEKGKKYKTVNPDAQEIFQKNKVTVPSAGFTDSDMKYRLLSRFANEALMTLEEGILRSPVEGDIGAVYGVGFPPCHGGPFRFVDTVGADRLVSIMRRFENVYGKNFTPCQLLLDHAKDPSKKFYK